MRFRTALLGGVLALVTGVVGATVAAVGVVIDRAAQREVAADLARVRQVFEDVNAYRRDLHRAEARVVAEEPRLKAVAAAEDVTHETVLGVVSEMKQALGSDIFLMTDGEGKLLADADQPSASGDDLISRPVVSRALASGDDAGLWGDDQAAYQVQAVRMAFGQTPVGVLVVGYRLDDRVAAAFERQTGAALVIELDGKVVALSPGLAASERAALGAKLASVPTSGAEPTEVTVGSGAYLASAAPMPGYEGPRRLRYVALRSLDRARAPGQRLLGVLLAIAAAGTAAAVALAALLSRRLARPLDLLVAFTERVGAGQLDARAQAEGPDEIRALAAALDRMVAELGRSRERLLQQDRLEKEMEIASSIQLSVLPASIDLPGLEGSARMAPASETGGDYYDARPAPDGGWIAVGDVAGHGLPAGLVMLMVQSMVATLTEQRPDASPSELVGALNRVLHDNIRRRLRQDAHVTFTLLRWRQDGQVTFAGAHEDLLLCRARGGPCESIPTPGTWLGVLRDIDRFTTDSHLSLDPGDLLVLYTDGITEARNERGEQFGPERLCAAIEAGRSLSPEALRDRILVEVRRWAARLDDDLTLVVLRRKAT